MKKKRPFAIHREDPQFEEAKLFKNGITTRLLEKYKPRRRLKTIERSETKDDNLRVA